MASTGNATDFGNVSDREAKGVNNRTRGVFHGGGITRKNTIEYITIQSTGNSVDFGDLQDTGKRKHWFLKFNSWSNFGGGGPSNATIQFNTLQFQPQEMLKILVI